MSGYLGIRNVFSTRKRATKPTVDGEPAEFDVWLSPSIPPWDYVPPPDAGPFRLIRTSLTHDDGVYGYVETADLSEAIALFSQFHLPRHGQCCIILDANAQILLSWGWDADQANFRWAGCQIAYGLLAVHRPVDAAIWESAAATALDIDLGEAIPRG